MTKKRWLLFTLGVIISLVGYHWKMVNYGISQAIGQLNIIDHTVDITEVLSNSLVSDSIKRKIELIQEIRQFSETEFGLKSTGNYTTYYEQKGLPILWVVTACSPFQLKEYQWDYPVLGKLGYMGFFRKSEADREAKFLDLQGLDTDVDEVNAWSTLGWLKDPILSSMMKMDEVQLARLIIHELTHSTIYIVDDAHFNENLATFVGDVGAKIFIESKYGNESVQAIKLAATISDSDKLSQHFVRGSKQLENLYSSLENLNYNQKQCLKQQQIKLIMDNLDTIKFSSNKKYAYLKDDSFQPNNTFFVGFNMYYGQQVNFDSLYLDRNGNLKQFIASYLN